jgi:syntaxin 18
MDITPLLSQSLANHNSALKAHPFDLDTLNSFLKEAYSINRALTNLTAYLRSIRAPYLALSSHRPASSSRHTTSNGAPKPSDKEVRSMTDVQREAVEQETKTLLDSLNRQISELDKAAQISSTLAGQIAQRTRAKRGFGGLGRWAAGGGIVQKSPDELEEEAKEETVRTHREGVIYFLRMRLARVSETQRNMVAVRLQRAVERNKSSLYKAGLSVDEFGVEGGIGRVERSKMGNGSASTTTDFVQLEEDQASRDNGPGIESLLSPEQIQMFQSEQDDMVTQLNSELQKIMYVDIRIGIEIF